MSFNRNFWLRHVDGDEYEYTEYWIMMGYATGESGYGDKNRLTTLEIIRSQLFSKSINRCP